MNGIKSVHTVWKRTVFRAVLFQSFSNFLRKRLFQENGLLISVSLDSESFFHAQYCAVSSDLEYYKTAALFWETYAKNVEGKLAKQGKKNSF